jgi:hypothetical protein
MIAIDFVGEFGTGDAMCCPKGHNIGRHDGAEIFKRGI